MIKISNVALNQEEIDRLLAMLKNSLMSAINFPSLRETKKFDVVGDTDKDIFVISIFRSKIKKFKYDLEALIKKNGIPLLELHINPSNVHRNPDGEKILGRHWHIYTEKYGRTFAFPAENIESEKFVENTIMFLKKFNVVKKPNIFYQIELEG